MVGGVDAVGVVEHLVEQVVDAVVGHHEPAPAPQAQGVDRGGPVERRRHVGPPVDHHRVAAGVLDVAAADVPAVAPSSSSRPKLRPGTSASRLARRWRRWAWAMAESTAWAAESAMVGGSGGAVAHGREAHVRPVDVGLLVGEIGMGHDGSLRASAPARRSPGGGTTTVPDPPAGRRDRFHPDATCRRHVAQAHRHPWWHPSCTAPVGRRRGGPAWSGCQGLDSAFLSFETPSMHLHVAIAGGHRSDDDGDPLLVRRPEGVRLRRLMRDPTFRRRWSRCRSASTTRCGSRTRTSTSTTTSAGTCSRPREAPELTDLTGAIVGVPLDRPGPCGRSTSSRGCTTATSP